MYTKVWLLRQSSVTDHKETFSGSKAFYGGRKPVGKETLCRVKYLSDSDDDSSQWITKQKDAMVWKFQESLSRPSFNNKP